jgi:protein gp37
MSDLFHENVPDEWRDRIFTVMALTPHHAYQLLTKRPENALRYLSDLKLRWYAIAKQAMQIEVLKSIPAEFYLPLDNVWVGTTIENQAMADKRIPVLLQIPAAVRWLSIEPLLEKIALDRYTHSDGVGWFGNQIRCSICGNAGIRPRNKSYSRCWICSIGKMQEFDSGISWCVIGGESGKGARPCHVEWVRSLVKQCEFAKVPVFVKQLGANPIICASQMNLCDAKGGDIAEFPEDLQIREFPNGRV